MNYLRSRAHGLGKLPLIGRFQVLSSDFEASPSRWTTKRGSMLNNSSGGDLFLTKRTKKPVMKDVKKSPAMEEKTQ
ncbi:MAG TPA: hypothetical protein GX399_08840 [Xanthomonadaceae bacterium]|nr:hypothetical protein [Xanthomonadaceae bacterium]